jgi:predicted metal-dependent hydrolase
MASTLTAEEIRVRKVNFDIGEMPRHYANDNIFATHYINSMHIVFPEGEKFFIRSARRYMDRIKDDPELLERVKKFIGQEGVHNKEHEKFWDILEAMNLKPRQFAKFYSYTAYNFLEKGIYKLIGKKRGDYLSLSITAALEHFTALLGDGGLRNAPFDKLPENVRLLLLWHAAEELEHKSVCFDLYEKVGGDYPTRVSGMVIASLFLWVYLLGGQIYFVAVDEEKQWSKLPKQWFDFMKVWLGNEGMTNIRDMYLDYYKKDFHPDDHDNYHLAREFFEKNKEYFKKMGVEA